MSGGKRDAAYWRHRVERDYPDVAERLASGEINSVRAAAIEAGLLHDPTALDHLRRAWRKASPDERSLFIEEIPRSAWPNLQQPVPNRDLKRKLLRTQPLGQGELFCGEAAEDAEAAAPVAINENTLLLPEAGQNGRAAPPPPAGGDYLPVELADPPPTRRAMAASSAMPVPAVAHAHQELPEAIDLAGLPVAIGEHYVKLDAGPDPWQVLSIFAGPSGVPHVRIVRLAEPDTIRVVSLTALADRRRYRLVQPTAPLNA
jgi:hypothetical protein